MLQAARLEAAHKKLSEIGIFQHSTESTSALFQNFLSMNDKQQTGLRTGKGFADICFIPRKLYADKPAAVIELKWDKDAHGAISQIKEKQYVDALKDYHGNLLLAGINYDKKIKQHTCVIERYHKQ